MLTDPAQKDSPRGQTPREVQGSRRHPAQARGLLLRWRHLGHDRSPPAPQLGYDDLTRYRRAMEEWAKDLSLAIETD
jgi:hypothetical protein